MNYPLGTRYTSPKSKVKVIKVRPPVNTYIVNVFIVDKLNTLPKSAAQVTPFKHDGSCNVSVRSLTPSGGVSPVAASSVGRRLLAPLAGFSPGDRAGISPPGRGGSPPTSIGGRDSPTSTNISSSPSRMESALIVRLNNADTPMEAMSKINEAYIQKQKLGDGATTPPRPGGNGVDNAGTSVEIAPPVSRLRASTPSTGGAVKASLSVNFSSSSSPAAISDVGGSSVTSPPQARSTSVTPTTGSIRQSTIPQARMEWSTVFIQSISQLPSASAAAASTSAPPAFGLSRPLDSYVIFQGGADFRIDWTRRGIHGPCTVPLKSLIEFPYTLIVRPNPWVEERRGLVQLSEPLERSSIMSEYTTMYHHFWNGYWAMLNDLSQHYLFLSKREEEARQRKMYIERFERGDVSNILLFQEEANERRALEQEEQLDRRFRCDIWWTCWDGAWRAFVQERESMEATMRAYFRIWDQQRRDKERIGMLAARWKHYVESSSVVLWDTFLERARQLYTDCRIQSSVVYSHEHDHPSVEEQDRLRKELCTTLYLRPEGLHEIVDSDRVCGDLFICSRPTYQSAPEYCLTPALLDDSAIPASE